MLVVIMSETTFKIKYRNNYRNKYRNNFQNNKHTLATKDNVNLTKQLNEGFKRPVYWNE